MYPFKENPPDPRSLFSLPQGPSLASAARWRGLSPETNWQLISPKKNTQNIKNLLLTERLGIRDWLRKHERNMNELLAAISKEGVDVVKPSRGVNYHHLPPFPLIGVTLDSASYQIWGTSNIWKYDKIWWKVHQDVSNNMQIYELHQIWDRAFPNLEVVSLGFSSKQTSHHWDHWISRTNRQAASVYWRKIPTQVTRQLSKMDKNGWNTPGYLMTDHRFPTLK